MIALYVVLATIAVLTAGVAICWAEERISREEFRAGYEPGMGGTWEKKQR